MLTFFIYPVEYNRVDDLLKSVSDRVVKSKKRGIL